MENNKTIVVSCESMEGICKYNDFGTCLLDSIELSCGECESFQQTEE